MTAYAKTAAEVYCGLNLLTAIAFNLLWNDAAQNGRLLAKDHDRYQAQRTTQQHRFGPLLYAAALALAFVGVKACIVMVGSWLSLPCRNTN